MGCFSGGSKGGSAAPVEKYTPDQQKIIKELSTAVKPAIHAVQGATIPGQEFAPLGPSPLQQQGFDLASGLPDQLRYDPQRIQEQFQPTAEFARQGFEQRTVPGIMGALGSQGAARHSGAADILGREGRNLELGLASQLGGQQYGAYQQSLDRAGQLPGTMAQMGGLQGSFPEAQRQYGLQGFLQGAPEADPRLGFLGPALSSSYDTAVQQGVYSPGLGSQALQLGGMLGMGALAGGYF